MAKSKTPKKKKTTPEEYAEMLMKEWYGADYGSAVN
jgi:hypothetical protein